MFSAGHWMMAYHYAFFKCPPPLLSHLFLLLPLLHLLVAPIWGQPADLSWPCFSNLCPDRVTPCSGDFGCPPPNCDPNNPADPICVGAGCARDASSPSGGKCGTYINFNRRKEGETCTKHSECRAMFLCKDGRCRASKRIGAYSKCTIRGVQNCTNGEQCFTGGTVSEEGVCLKPTMDTDQFQLELGGGGGGMGGKCANNNTAGQEGAPCKQPDQSCDVPFMCIGGCCAKTVDNRNGRGQRLPPQPHDPNCRDALESGETDTDNSKCVGKEDLCTQRMYRELMREQCPKTCGYCDGEGPAEDDDEWEEERDEGRNGHDESTAEGETVKVDPTAECSDRKRSGHESDCARLKGRCDDPIYEALMRVQCPKTCGFCGGADGGVRL